MREQQQVCTFRIADELFGIELEHVQEIILDQPMTRIPLAPCAVAGLINLRGQIVPTIDLRRCFALGPRTGDVLAPNIVVSTDAGPVSLRVDEIGDVLEVSAESFEPPPDNLRGVERTLIRGVYKLERRLLLVLAVDVAIDLALSAATPRAEVGAGMRGEAR